MDLRRQWILREGGDLIGERMGKGGCKVLHWSRLPRSSSRGRQVGNKQERTETGSGLILWSPSLYRDFQLSCFLSKNDSTCFWTLLKKPLSCFVFLIYGDGPKSSPDMRQHMEMCSWALEIVLVFPKEDFCIVCLLKSLKYLAGQLKY